MTTARPAVEVPVTRRRTVVPLVLAVALAAACGGTPDVAAPGTATPAPSAPPAATAPTAAASPAAPSSDAAGNLEALDFVAPDLAGGQVRGADYAGEDVVLWMWAPW